MELGADNGTSDGAMLGDATVVVLLGLADGTGAASAANDGIMVVLSLAWSSVMAS